MHFASATTARHAWAATLRHALRRITGVLGVALALLVWPSIGAAGAWPEAALSGGAGAQPLDGSIRLFEDAAGSLGIAAVRALPPERWHAPRGLPVHLGFSRSSWWLRVRIRNPLAEPQLRLFEIGSALQDRLEVFVVHEPQPAGPALRTFGPMGDRIRFADRPIRAVNPTVPLRLAAHETLDVYVKADSHDGLFEVLPFNLLTEAAFADAERRHWWVSGLGSGVLFAILFYSGVIAAAVRDRIFVLYFGYLASAFVWQTIFRGDAFFLLWPERPVLNNRLLPLAVGAWIGFGASFFASFLDVRHQLPRWHRPLLGVAACSAAGSLLALFDHYALAFAVMLPLGLLWASGNYLCGIVLARRGLRQAWWPLLAWGPVLVGGIGYTLQMAGWLAPGDVYANLLQIALVWQALVIGLGLAHSAYSWRMQKMAAEQGRLAAQAALSDRLETEVAERTRALEDANRQLQDQAITDALTGVFNRRHFNAVLAHEIKRHSAQGNFPVLCLIDVDRFKTYNDRYGHQMGDLALQAVAHAMQAQLRRAGDALFRVGGEEFAVLMQPGDPDRLTAAVEALRVAVESIGIAHADHPAGVLTASFGLVLHLPCGTPQSAAVSPSRLYREADRLLYAAKAQGRNRVVSDARPPADWAITDTFSVGRA